MQNLLQAVSRKIALETLTAADDLTIQNVLLLLYNSACFDYRPEHSVCTNKVHENLISS